MQGEISVQSAGATLTSTTNTEAELQAALGAPPAAEPPAAPPAPPPPDDDGSDDEVGASPDAAASDAGRTLASRKRSFQARINELHAQKMAEKARADALEAELQALRTPVPEPQPPKEDEYQDYDQLEEARRRYSAQRVLHETSVAQQHQALAARVRAEQEAALRAHSERLAQAAASMPDFEATVNQPIQISQEMRVAIIESELGPQLAYYFGKHPDEAARIGELRGSAALREIGKLEARLEAASPGPASEAPRSMVPPPIKPVGGGATASRLPLDHPNVSMQEYYARRDAGER